MSTSNLINVVRQYLATQHMFVDEDWVSGCVEYLCEDNGNNPSESNIKNLAREQWLLNDLKDICPGSLPANLKSLPKTELNGRFVLQINAAFDIGTPAYQQHLKIQKVNMENVEATTNFEDKISSHRMIKLHLTDGVQEITAIEYKQMRNLSCDITPGCKVLIKGPVVCRQGMLLLTEGAVELLGGEVQEIAVSNSLAGLLATKLGLPMQATDLNTTTHRNTTIPTPHTQMPPPATFEQPDRPVARVTSLQAAFNDEDIDLDQLEHIEAQITDIPTKRPLSNTFDKPEKKIKIDSSSDKIGTSNVDTIDLTQVPVNKNIGQKLENIKIDLTHISENTKPVSKSIAKIDLTIKVNTVDDYPDENDFLDEDEEYLREMEAKFDNLPCASANKVPISTSEPTVHLGNQSYTSRNKVPFTADSEPYVYIKQINDLSDSQRAGKVFKVKGQIMKLLSKLSVGKEGWSLRCTLVDGTGSIDVDFTSDVLSKLVGYTPQEMIQLKKQMVTKPEIKEKAACALQNAKVNLQMLYCIIELTMLEVPKITCLTPFDATHAYSQRKRLDASGF